MVEIAAALQDLQAGRFESAEQRCVRLLASDPQNADALIIAAVARAERALPGEAIAFADRAVAARPGDTRLRFNRALILTAAGRTAEAIADYAEVCRLDAANLPARINLVRLLLPEDRLTEAELQITEGLAANPENPEMLEMLGLLRQYQKRTSDAIAAFRRSLALRPGSPGVQANLGWSLLVDGQPAEAARHLRDAIAARPELPELWVNLGVAAMLEQDWPAALESLGRALALSPAHTRALALKGIALDELGRPAERQQIVDLQQFVVQRQLKEAPAGYASLREFNAELAQHARTHPTLVSERLSKTTRKGSQSGELTGSTARAMAGLENALREAIDAYIRAMPDRGIYASSWRPQRWKLRAWATVLASEGYQDPHHHPSGWISGVYYAAVPPEIRADDPAHAGWIEFGRPDPFFGGHVVPELRLFHPEEGAMLLFPSYAWHRTIPFVSASPRVSIAFDVVPL